MITTIQNFGSGWEVRAEAPERPALSAEDIAENEASRKSKRDSIKRRIAQAELAEERWRELSQAMADCEARKDSLASQHVDACAPLQAELAEIDRKELEAVVSRAPRNSGLQARRAHLAQQIREHNAALELAIATEDRILRQLGAERREAGMASESATLRNELIDCTSPALAVQVRLWSGKAMSASARVDAIRDAIARGRRDAYTHALLEDAESELARAQEMSAAAIAAALDE